MGGLLDYLSSTQCLVGGVRRANLAGRRGSGRDSRLDSTRRVKGVVVRRSSNIFLINYNGVFLLDKVGRTTQPLCRVGIALLAADDVGTQFLFMAPVRRISIATGMSEYQARRSQSTELGRP